METYYFDNYDKWYEKITSEEMFKFDDPQTDEVGYCTLDLKQRFVLPLDIHISMLKKVNDFKKVYDCRPTFLNLP